MLETIGLVLVLLADSSASYSLKRGLGKRTRTILPTEVKLHTDVTQSPLHSGVHQDFLQYLFFFFRVFKVGSTPNIGLEFMTLRSSITLYTN